MELHRPVHRLVASILDDLHGAVAVERDVQVIHFPIDAVALQSPALEALHHTVGRILHHLLIVAVVVRAEVVGAIDGLRQSVQGIITELISSVLTEDHRGSPDHFFTQRHFFLSWHTVILVRSVANLRNYSEYSKHLNEK